MRRAVLVMASAAVFVGCPDWDSFSHGSGDADAGDGGPSMLVDAAPKEDASPIVEAGSDGDAALAPAVTIDVAPEAQGAFDLTALGPTDWLEAHQEHGNRCQPCARAISSVTTNGSPLDTYADDPRKFTWSNGTPQATGMMTGGLLTVNVGSSFSFSVTPNGQRQLLTMHLNTYYSGASIQARFDGIDVPSAKQDLEALGDGARYAVKIHFTAPSTAKLLVDFTETKIVTPQDANDTPNIAFSAVTLAPDL